jgi:hypothetical protein
VSSTHQPARHRILHMASRMAFSEHFLEFRHCFHSIKCFKRHSAVNFQNSASTVHQKQHTTNMAFHLWTKCSAVAPDLMDPLTHST